MAWTNAFLVPGVTMVARKAGSTYALLTDPTAGVAAVEGVDYSVDGTGVITLLGWGFGSLAFFFTDAGGTLAAAPEFPAIAMRGNYDTTMIPNMPGYGFAYINEAIRGAMTVSAGRGAMITQLTDTAYTGGDLILGIYNDGSAPTQDATGSKLGLELDISEAPPPPDYFWTDNVRCTEYLPI